MFIEENKIDSILRIVAIKFLCIITAIFLFYTIFFYSQDLKMYTILAAFGTFFNFFLICIPYRLKYESVKPIIPFYLLYISLSIYPFIIFHWQVGYATGFVWLFIIPPASMLFFSLKSAILWFIYVCILLISVFFVSPILPHDYAFEFTQEQTTILTSSTLVFCLILIFLSLYYIHKVNFTSILKNDNEESLNEQAKELSIEKYSELYNQIIELFEKEKPYCDPDFTISQLATSIDSNVNYISKAIKYNMNANFNLLVNTYRINMIKNLLNNDVQNKYTIRHIYTSCGFKHQSTFNKVFKQIEGITPSDYIKNHLHR